MLWPYMGSWWSLCVLLSQFVSAQSPSSTVSPIYRTETFLSRPSQTSLILDILEQTEDSSLLSPGHIFIAPYYTFFGRSKQPQPKPNPLWHPQIFDQEGNLVWVAEPEWVEERAWPFGVCDFRGQKGVHLCMGDGTMNIDGGYSFGRIRLFNNSYDEVARYGPTAGLVGPDGHELNMIQDGYRMLQDVYMPVARDLRAFGGEKDGWIFNGCFQEINVTTGEAEFTWCSADHIPLDESYMWPNGLGETSLRGQKGSHETPWDYTHINSVDKDDMGDYYVSFKHLNSIHKIAGPSNTWADPGSIIWKFGGIDNHFEFQEGLNFSWQHHLRVESVGASTTVISLFDNGWQDPVTNRPEVILKTANISNGLVIELDNVTMLATTLEQYISPNGLYSPVQGTTQRLPNGNMFMAWGPNNVISEHAVGLPGKVLFYAVWGDGLDLEGYRSYKYPWKGYPSTQPDIFVYSLDCEGAIHAYMSWNGATEYTHWSIFASDSEAGPGSFITNTTRTGYETTFEIAPSANSWRFISAQATDQDGHVLGRSRFTEIFIPDESTKSTYECNSSRCDSSISYRNQSSIASSCSQDNK